MKPFVAFAIAHSITLMFAAFGLAPMGTWFAPTIGALIALSLVYVAIENGVGGFFRAEENPSRPRFQHRWIVALVFGLFHGLGFAVALQETLQFAGSHHLAALAAYNVGLELGTSSSWRSSCRRRPPVHASVPERAGIIVLSVLIGHAGWHWMTERFTIAQLWDWPSMDLPFLLTLVRWLLALR